MYCIYVLLIFLLIKISSFVVQSKCCTKCNHPLLSWYSVLVAGCWCDLRGSGGQTVAQCNSGADRGEDTPPTTQESEPRHAAVWEISTIYIYYLQTTVALVWTAVTLVSCFPAKHPPLLSRVVLLLQQQIRLVGVGGDFQQKFLELGHYASFKRSKSEIYYPEPDGVSSINNRIRTIS